VYRLVLAAHGSCDAPEPCGRRGCSPPEAAAEQIATLRCHGLRGPRGRCGHAGDDGELGQVRVGSRPVRPNVTGDMPAQVLGVCRRLKLVYMCTCRSP
jgi:hypothetical protein